MHFFVHQYLSIGFPPNYFQQYFISFLKRISFQSYIQEPLFSESQADSHLACCFDTNTLSLLEQFSGFLEIVTDCGCLKKSRDRRRHQLLSILHHKVIYRFQNHDTDSKFGIVKTWSEFRQLGRGYLHFCMSIKWFNTLLVSLWRD